MELRDAVLESWERQARIVENIGGRVDSATRFALPSPDGWPLIRHLAHIHEVRYGWLSRVSPNHVETLGEVFQPDGETAIDDLDLIRSELAKSGFAVGEAVREMLTEDAGAVGPYSHPILFLQHMIWHEGWHCGLIVLGLRLAGQEPPEAWEETNVWGLWRSLPI